MAITLDEARTAELIRQLQGFFLEEFDEEDARVFMAQKLDDLDAEIHEREGA